MDRAATRLTDLSQLLRALLPFVVSMVIVRASVVPVVLGIARACLPSRMRKWVRVVVRPLQWVRGAATVVGALSACASAHTDGVEWSVCRTSPHTRVHGLATATALTILMCYSHPLPTLLAICALVAVRDLSSSSVLLAGVAGCAAVRRDVVAWWLWLVPVAAAALAGGCVPTDADGTHPEAHAAVLVSTLVGAYYFCLATRASWSTGRAVVERLVRTTTTACSARRSPRPSNDVE